MDTAESPPDFAMAARLNDADHLAEVVRGWDLDFRQLDPGRIDARLAHVVAGPVLITECSMTRRIEQRGAPPPGFRTIAIPANDEMKVRWRGENHDGSNLMLFRPGKELDSISDSRFHVYTVSVTESWLQAIAVRRESDALNRFQAGSGVVACDPERRRQLRNLAAFIVDTATSRPAAITESRFREMLEGEFVPGLLEALSRAPAIGRRPMARVRSRALRKAIEVIGDRAHEPVSVSEVEELSGASTRTLRYAFQEAFGVSPKQYLQARRLNEVRRRLRKPRPEAMTISEIANDWGFWHMGQFAKDYHRMFGELPSETQAGSKSRGFP